ncbi:caffeoylshikimate esterase-like isoform X2 [Diospyros lotus]|uniref:caffeoylshikimate esterase-like isoform X2 n=1 Tax=Diospyros lotus TaxID=55363 RepID=UPI002259ADA6|nr:caffeoylshikimate esterase-like isoform X2 [Diospyros lotus]
MAHDTDEGIIYGEEFIVNARGMELFTCRWVPAESEAKALILLCHGYGVGCSISMRGAATRLAKAGYEVYGMDYEGHGKSSGLQGFVPCFDDVVSDCSHHYTSICEREENRNKLRIVMGESMGGAVALLLHRKKPHFWDGAILVAPMCKIADGMRPHPLMIKVLRKLSRLIPTWKITPIPDIIDAAVRDASVREQIPSNPYCYKGRLRLLTGYQLLTVSMDLEKRLEEVSLPFLVLHGEEDKVTDPAVSRLLYDSARTPIRDKTLKLYPEMWHSLYYGELPHNIDTVFSDILAWLDERLASSSSDNLERQLKLENDNDVPAASSTDHTHTHAF